MGGDRREDDYVLTKMNYPAAEQRGIRCHAGLVADCSGLISYSQHDPASSLDFWIPTFILPWRISRNDDSPKPDMVLKT